MWPFYDQSILLIVPAIVFAMWAQWQVKATFNRYLKVQVEKGLSGGQVARALLDDAGLHNVPVEMISTSLADHYDPRQRRLRLSPEVYNGSTVASLGVAAHETGHAIQHKEGYIALSIRNSLYPVAALGSNAAFPLAIMGILLGLTGLITLGIYLFTAALLFQLITLPVEYNASKRAQRLLTAGGYVTDTEASGVHQVLRAAALTYVAATAVALTQLLRLLILRNSQRR